MTSTDDTLFRTWSIRSRMAYATICVENAVTLMDADSEEVRSIIELFWAFIEQPDLCWWDEHSRECVPLMAICDVLDLGHPIPNEMPVAALPRFLMQMIEVALEIGEEELYVGMVGESEATLAKLREVIDLAHQHNVPTPSPRLFAATPFTDDGGFGAPRARDSYRPL